MATRRRQCAAMQEYERLLEEQPSFRGNQQRAEAFTARAVMSGEAERVARRVVTIPTVVHVVHKKPSENISKAQVQSQIAALNQDFRATNPDVSQVPAPVAGAGRGREDHASSSPRGTPTASAPTASCGCRPTARRSAPGTR